jgi:ubiquinone/menaquinone biosynthesis C-methylase UbiE
MADRNAAFVGSIPATYDRYLGPLFFHAFADDLTARLAVKPNMRVLETACGTGIVTERVAAALAGQGTVVATDLNEPMVAYASQRLGAGARIEWRQADATALPFDDGSFDAVVCQFGVMFYPDKALGLREAFRVLRSGGRYLFSVWDSLEQNPVPRITHETVTSFFPVDPPQFYTIPFSLSDTERVKGWLRDARFVEIESHSVTKTGTSPSIDDAALGLIEGNPIAAQIAERSPDALGPVKATLARNLAAHFGNQSPLRAPLRAIVFSARKP